MSAGSPLLGEYAEPIYQPVSTLTGKTRVPVTVVRAKVRNPVFKLDLDELEIGLYCVRMIGAVAPVQGREIIAGKVNSIVRLPLFVTLKVNDGIGGETSAYRQRCGYQDEFYSLSELYFHAPAKRRYTAELFVDEGSGVEVLVHTISLDDSLAGVERRAVKTRMTLASPEERARVRELIGKYKTDPPAAHPDYFGANANPFTREERWMQDERVWKSLPPINLQPSAPPHANDMGANPGITIGTPEKRPEDESGERTIGGWTYPRRTGPIARSAPVFAEHAGLKLAYTLDDLQARKPLPAPYPYPDDGSRDRFE